MPAKPDLSRLFDFLSSDENLIADNFCISVHELTVRTRNLKF